MKEIKFYILSDTERKELQKILLDTYCDIAELCQKYDLKMLLGGGSCLGAVRHKGFIPWDDDIDLVMPRSDYNRFLEIFDQELGEKYHLVDMLKTHSGQKTFTKIMKKNTTFREIVTNVNSPTGIFVDIFPLEFLPDNRLLRSIFLIFANIFTKLIFVITGYQLLSDPHSKYRKIAKYRIIGWLTSFMSAFKWDYLYTIFISSCRGNKFCFLPSGGHGVYGELLPVDIYFPLSEGIFEGIKVKLPHKYDLYLKNLYGNYMELPPVDKRISHPVISFSTNSDEKWDIKEVNEVPAYHIN
jgi:lipopolysaccharide cholinephosphotransferase